MKRIVCITLVFLLSFSLFSCGGTVAGDVDIDISRMSDTMAYSEVSNMTASPEDYIGKTVRMRGKFTIYRGGADTVYYACRFDDATSCCSQSLEFLLLSASDYPDDGARETKITVRGVFDTYEEGGNRYCRLIRGELE